MSALRSRRSPRPGLAAAAAIAASGPGAQLAGSCEILLILPSGEHRLTVDKPGLPGPWAAEIHWWADGEIEGISVHPSLRRRGIATALWGEAKRITPALRHSRSQTPAGRAWAEAEASRRSSRTLRS